MGVLELLSPGEFMGVLKLPLLKLPLKLLLKLLKLLLKLSWEFMGVLKLFCPKIIF